MKFVFDLDGTLTHDEIVPLIVSNFNVQNTSEVLTNYSTIENIPFIESFIRLVNILGEVSVNETNDIIGKMSIHEDISRFIEENKENCIIVTQSLKCWCEKLLTKIDCEYYCSEAIVEEDKIAKISKILKKEDIVKILQSKGEFVVYVGDGNNDLEAMRLADVAIAVGFTHTPARSILTISDYIIFNTKTLCHLLNQLLSVAQE